MRSPPNLRGQLTCFLASTGVGKSHMAKHIGIHANVDDGLHVLHFQLEGSEEEALNAYSGGLIQRNAFYFERGKISETEMRHFEKEVEAYLGSITIRSFPRFNARVSSLDIKTGIAEYRKINSHNPDVVIIDSMDLLTDASRRQWGAEHERSKRIAVANDLKDLAGDEALKREAGKEFNVISVCINANADTLLARGIDPQRVERDKGRKGLDFVLIDRVIHNNGTQREFEGAILSELFKIEQWGPRT